MYSIINHTRNFRVRIDHGVVQWWWDAVLADRVVYRVRVQSWPGRIFAQKAVNSLVEEVSSFINQVTSNIANVSFDWSYNCVEFHHDLLSIIIHKQRHCEGPATFIGNEDTFLLGTSWENFCWNRTISLNKKDMARRRLFAVLHSFMLITKTANFRSSVRL